MSAMAASIQATVSPATTQRSLDTIRTVLKRDVAEILHQHLPALAMVPADKVYDRVLDDPALLHQGFRLLRSRPELFQNVIVTPEKAFPSADGDVLFCGRTMAEVIAMVVRACARRYFKKRLGPAYRPAFRPAAKPGLFHGMAIALGWAAPPKAPKAKRPQSPGDRLFAAMRNLLLYDWQVPLIPSYAQLSPQAVTDLGPRLLEVRDPMALEVLTGDHVAASQFVAGKVPLLLDDATRLMKPDGAGINAEVLWTVAQKMHVGVLFPDWDTSEMRRAVSMVSATAPAALQVLAPVLGNDIRAFTLFLFTAYSKIGNVQYKQVFGPQGQTWVVRAIAARMKAEPVAAPSLDLMKQRMETLLEGAVDRALSSPPQG